MNKKRKFRIEGGNNGGETVIGTVSVEFVKYWQQRDSGDLIEHLESIREGKEGDANSPPMRDGKNFSWQENDNIEHLLRPYAPSAENGFKVEEIITGGVGINEKQVINEKQITDDAVQVYGREIYTSQINIDDENPDDDVSLLTFHRHEKGDLASWLVETDGEDFNPKKLAYGALETIIYGDFIDSVYYDKKELVKDGGGDTQTNVVTAHVGVIESSWIKDHSKANTLKNLEWDYYDELLKEK